MRIAATGPRPPSKKFTSRATTPISPPPTATGPAKPLRSDTLPLPCLAIQRICSRVLFLPLVDQIPGHGLVPTLLRSRPWPTCSRDEGGPCATDNTITFGSMEGRYIPMPVLEVQTPLKRFQRWVKLSQPNAYDKPTKQEYTLVTVAVLFAPVILAFASVYIFFQPEFLTLRPGKRVLFVIVLPFLFPAAYCYVIFGDLLWPLVKRVWLRAQLMRKAERAVRELMNELQVTRNS